MLGKRSNLKLKTVTIIHSATTETVRLPDDNNGVNIWDESASRSTLLNKFSSLNSQVIVHTAIRTKVPLKKKVRGERSKTKHQHSKEIVQSNSATNALATQTVAPLSKVTKRPQTTDSPRKLLKKKKKRASADESPAKKEVDVVPVKPTRKLKKKSKHKEIIDYSNTEHANNHTNTFGKVQKWLLESPIVSSAASQIEHSSRITNIMSKSQSTPEHLVLNQRAQSNSKVKTKSVGNLNEKVRLQVVYKPPFKFSLKLSKNENSVKTNVVSGGSVMKVNKRKNRIDRQRLQTIDDSQRNRRTALLIRTPEEPDAAVEPISEPNYETLNPKQHQRQKSLTVEMPNYENLNFPSTSTANLMDTSLPNSTTSPINTATFRVNKSGSSGGNITNNRNLPVIAAATPVLSNSRKTTGSHKGSQQNLSNQFGTNGSGGSNATKFGGSTQNLIRSSTTNLSKNHRNNSFEIKRRGSGVAAHEMNRSSTTNLNKHYRPHSNYGSNSNLRKSNLDLHNGDDGQHCSANNSAERRGHSRRNSANLPRTFSNSNLQNILTNTSAKSGTNSKNSSLRRDSFNNIPRASLATNIPNNNNNNFHRQTSLNMRPSSDRQIIEAKHPQTASACDKHFEWPKALSSQKPLQDDILPSDLEVMVSDVENLVSDR